jgi:hypothetical protein
MDHWYEQVFAILRILQEDLADIKMSLAALNRSLTNIEEMAQEWPI